MAGNCQYVNPQPGEWVKGKLIGAGSFGSVHLAMNKTTGGLFVVKSAQSGAGFKALKNEADILQSLNSSPYVVQFLGTDNSAADNFNFFMEYMAGGSLADVAEKFGGSLDEEVVRLYTKEILQGLKFLHEHGIVHCDVKSNNVLLGLSGNIKLADFGSAKRVKDLMGKSGVENSWQSIGGTPLWMAPEVLRNEGLFFAADIWSLGCTIIEMATGRPPWGDDVSNPMAAILKIALSDEMPQFPTKFSKEGLDFLAKCLQRDPERRWTADNLLSHPFISCNSSITSEKEVIGSPASVLEFGVFEDGYDSNESESPNEIHVPIRNPLSRCSGDSKGAARCWEHEGSEIWSSENWITVRSG
ncbi:Protein kinase domain [Quillaja saponaria]|uniref:Protein kinase domain n=1 Tax=Quillaja saponaria TaxID=32244 RepID=A0AAD7M119_QUISA|nr:Protein kinase domain [Quillaja saponaria]